MEKSPDISDLGSIYSCLAHNHPQLMKKLLHQVPDCLLYSEDKESVIRHVALASLHSEDFPLITRKVAEMVISILTTKWLLSAAP